MKVLKIAFDRNELAGAFGDLGTFIPLVTAMIVINRLDPAGIFLTFGLFYILSGLFYGIPVPIQPMKAMAAIMITTNPPSSQLMGAGLVIGIFFTVLAFTNAIGLVDRVTPKSVVRGIQAGLGINLILLACNFMQRGSLLNWILSVIGVFLVLVLFTSRKVPPALVLIFLGISFSIFKGFPLDVLISGVKIALPNVSVPSMNDIVLGTVTLAIPQIPLTIGNAIIATSLLSRDFFPGRKAASVRRLSLSVGLMNLISPFVGGIPTCHGAGGMAGHYRFGARTGGALIIIGIIFAILGVFYSGVVLKILDLFPFAVLGVLLFFAGLELILTIRDVAAEKSGLFVALFVAAICVGISNGYAIGLIGGILLAYAIEKKKLKLFED